MPLLLALRKGEKKRKEFPTLFFYFSFCTDDDDRPYLLGFHGPESAPAMPIRSSPAR